MREDLTEEMTEEMTEKMTEQMTEELTEVEEVVEEGLEEVPGEEIKQDLLNVAEVHQEIQTEVAGLPIGVANHSREESLEFGVWEIKRRYHMISNLLIGRPKRWKRSTEFIIM